MKFVAPPEAYHEYRNSRHSLRRPHTDRKISRRLAGFSAPELGGKAVAEAIRRSGLEAKQIDEAILGNVVQAGLGQNPARQAALKGGCDARVAQ